MKKRIVFYLILIISNAAFAQKTAFPPYGNFSEIENLVSVQYNGLLTKNAFQILSKDDLQQLVNLTAKAENILNGGWALTYVGYLKRAEARILFTTATVISQQPDFYQNRNLLQIALGDINRGFDYLVQYPQSVYPPYVEINTEYKHDAEGKTTGTIATKMSVQVDEGKATLLRSQINEALGNGEKALDDYYTSVGNNYSLSPADDSKTEASFIIATRIIELSLQQKKYDQRLVDFCTWALTFNKIDEDEVKKRSASWKMNWNKLEPLLLQALDTVANDNSPTKYIIYFKDDKDRAKSTSYDWIIPVMNKFDTKDKLVTFQEKKRDTDPGNRTVFNLIHYCMSIVEGNATAELSTAANAILQKHFTEIANLAMTWYKYPYESECQQLKWIADRFDKYPVDEKDKKGVLKLMKKCKAYLH